MQHRLGSKGRVWQGGYNPLKQMCGTKPLSLSAKNTTQEFSCLSGILYNFEIYGSTGIFGSY